MVSQVHSIYNLRNRTVNNIVGKASGIFIKDRNHKMHDRNKPKENPVIEKIKDSKTKKQEPKKKVEFQGVQEVKTKIEEKKSSLHTVGQIEEPIIQVQEPKGYPCKPLIYCHVDIISMLSQIIIKVPLLEIFKIEETQE